MQELEQNKAVHCISISLDFLYSPSRFVCVSIAFNLFPLFHFIYELFLLFGTSLAFFLVVRFRSFSLSSHLSLACIFRVKMRFKPKLTNSAGFSKLLLECILKCYILNNNAQKKYKPNNKYQNRHIENAKRAIVVWRASEKEMKYTTIWRFSVEIDYACEAL